MFLQLAFSGRESHLVQGLCCARRDAGERPSAPARLEAMRRAIIGLPPTIEPFSSRRHDHRIFAARA
jgi:hypothetical protein